MPEQPNLPDYPHADESVETTTVSEQRPHLFIKTFGVGPLRCNCTIIGDPITKQAIVADPGGDADKILKILDEEGFTVSRIIHTHAHFDHFMASGDMHDKTGAPLCLHQADKPLWEHLEDQCNLYSLPYKPVPSPHHWLED